MPLYDYICYACGYQAELLVPNRDALRSCEKCGAKLERKYPSATPHYRGLGFFTTENRKVTEYDEHNLPKVW